MTAEPNFVSKLYRFLVWEQEVQTLSAREFEQEFEDMRVKSLVEDDLHIPAPLFVFLIPVLGYLPGFLISWWSGIADQFMRNSFLIVYFFILTLSVVTVLWLEPKLSQAIVSMSDSFDVESEEYYRFMGDFLERLTEPLPHVAYHKKGKYLHRPLLFISLSGGIFFVILPGAFYPGQVSRVVGFKLTTLPLLLQVYLSSLLLVAVIIGALVSWVIIVSAVYLGIRIQDYKIRLDITKEKSNLGFAQYSNLVFKALLFYLVAYIVATVFLLNQLTVWGMLAVIMLSAIPVSGFVVSQYGIHKAIVRSKEERLNQIRSEFDDELDVWFSFQEPNPKESQNSTDISEVIEAKRAIEEIPDWPVNMSSVFKLISATFASNIWVLAQLAGIIS